jgi:glycosyltransferase involved in cell wall biosynthesis
MVAPKRVCIFVANNCTVDSRILRQAETFARAGHETIIVAVLVGDVEALEKRGGFEIRRVNAKHSWSEGYPRASKVLSPVRARIAKRNGDNPAPQPVLPRRNGPRIPARQWLRWIRTGKEPAPRSWPAAESSTMDRAAFAASMPLQKAGRVARAQRRRWGRRVGRFGRRRILRPTRYRQIERRMARAAIEFRADLYWANDVQTLRPAAAAARATGGRVVYDAHEVVWDVPTVSWFRQRVWALIERTQIPKMDRVYTVCDPIADLMASRYRISRPTVIINAPRLESTSAAPAHEDSPLNAYRKPGERIVLFHGYLAPWRGIEQLIAATALLPQEYRLVILGHGVFRATLEELAHRSRLDDRVTFIASVPPAELPSWVIGADVGTIPIQNRGRSFQYTTPNKLFECLHVGLPIVVNDLPEIRKVVNEVDFGIVTDCSDPAAISKAIEELLSDPDRYQQMRHRARAAAPRYSWERGEGAILSALEK